MRVVLAMVLALLLPGADAHPRASKGAGHPIGPAWPGAGPGNARLLAAAGGSTDTSRLAGHLLTEDPQNADTLYRAGLAALERDDPAAAIPHLEAACRLAPRNLAARKLLAKAYLLARQQRQAEAAIEELTKLAPADPEGWSLLGRLYQDSLRFREAIAPLERALRLEKDHPDPLTLTSLANANVGTGDFEQADATFRKAVAANALRSRPFALPHASYAHLLLRLDRLAEAGEQMRRALAINPRDAMALEVQSALAPRHRRERQPATRSAVPASLSPPVFKDVAIQAGLGFRLENSPTEVKHQVETMPGGVAVLDFDNDGWMDIYFSNGAESPSLRKSGPKFWNRLYRNNGNGTFTDVTEKAGVQGEGYTMGAAAGDFDNDGYPDLFVTGVRRNLLYHNNRDGTFTEMAAKAGFNRPHPKFGVMWGIHAAWLDYDRDGWLDLLVVNYCVWDPAREPFCGDRNNGRRAYCHPRYYDALPNQLYHNNHDGSFTDVSEPSGIGAHLGKGMGAAIADYDGDGWPDIFVANDTEFNFLFHNLGNGRFEEVAMRQGVASNQFGKAVSSMGADFRDVDNDGHPDLFVTDLSNEGFLLFFNLREMFEDVSDRARVTLSSLRFGGWSNAIADLNNDGWKDLFSANGHTIDNATESGTVFRQRNSIFQQVAPGLFRDVSEDAGSDFRRAAAHRGAAVADFDNDGRLDIVVTALEDRPELFHNITPAAGHWLSLRLAGRRSNRSGLGARVKLETADGLTVWNHATTSVGFASSSDPRVHFGLGGSSVARTIEIAWPSGRLQILHDVAAGQVLEVIEPDE